MIDSTRTFDIPVADLGVTAEAIRAAANVPEDLPSVEEMLSGASERARVRSGVRRFDSLDVNPGDGRIEVPGGAFRPGRIVTPQLEGATSATILVTTLGPEFDSWSDGFFEKGDPYLGFLADSIGSMLAEAAAEETQRRIEEDLATEGLRTTRRFSPGYCGWDVAEQRILFSLFPEAICGITLSDAAFMTPVKSVSALIGVGADVAKTAYPCRRCDDEDCPNRRDEG